MKKMYILGIPSAVVLFLAGALIESRGNRAQGAYSSPVSIMNTPSGPAIVSGAGRIPYRSSVTQACNGGIVYNCDFAFTAVPAGHRLFVKTIGGEVEVGNNFPVTVSLSASSVFASWMVNTFSQLLPSLYLSSFTQNLDVVFDPSDGAPHVTVGANYTSSGSQPQVVTINGYLEDCSVVGCPAIQH